MAKAASPLHVATESEAVLSKLNDLLDFEMSGISRYLHYSFMTFGQNRLPITKWFRDQAEEGMDHARQIGEWVTGLGGHPSVRQQSIEDSDRHDVGGLLNAALEFERQGFAMYHDLLGMVRDKNVALEEWVRDMIKEEQGHIFELEKLLRA